MEYPEIPEPITFDWDNGNQTKNLHKHGITTQDAEETFFAPKLVSPDQRHSKTEPRFGMLGQTNAGAILFIAFTIRKKQVRIISARPANKQERELYEEATKKNT
jgi:uncharacterized DUF497 family protein